MMLVPKRLKKLCISNDWCTRYQSTGIQKLLKVATYLDPHCKALPFLLDSKKKLVVEDLEDYLSAEEVIEDLESSNSPEETVDLTEVAQPSAESTPPVKKITKL